MTMTLHRQSDARFPGKRHPLGQLMLALYGLGISGAGLLAPAVAQAQAETAAAPAMDIQEVVVTARKRSETLIEVPVSIQSFSDKDLRAAGVTEITDLTTKSGFSFTSAQGNGAQGRAFGVDINATHHRPGVSGWVNGEATALHIGGRLGTWEITLTNDAGELMCTARVTCALLRPPPV